MNQTFWISSNISAAVGPINAVGAAAAVVAGGGKGLVGEDDGGDDNVVARTRSGSGEGSPAGATKAGVTSCADEMLLYTWP